MFEGETDCGKQSITARDQSEAPFLYGCKVTVHTKDKRPSPPPITGQWSHLYPSFPSSTTSCLNSSYIFLLKWSRRKNDQKRKSVFISCDWPIPSRLRSVEKIIKVKDELTQLNPASLSVKRLTTNVYRRDTVRLWHTSVYHLGSVDDTCGKRVAWSRSPWAARVMGAGIWEGTGACSRCCPGQECPPRDWH